MLAAAIEVIDDRQKQYHAGREILIDFYTQNPQGSFAVAQGTKYLFARLEMQALEQT